MTKPLRHCALCLGFLCCIAQVQASNIQYRSSIGVTQQLASDWKLTFSDGIRSRNAEHRIYYNDSELGLGYGGLASWLDVSFNMKWAFQEDRYGHWHQEVRPHFNVTVKHEVLGMTLKDRSRIEYRELEGVKDRWRLRNQLKAEMPWTFSPLKLKPYVGDEVLFYLDGTGFYSNRVMAGVTMPISTRLSGNLYYYWDKVSIDNRVSWIEQNVIGFKLHFSF